MMRFVDTNILIYSLDLEPAEPAKTAIAREILTHLEIALSVQVLQEFYVPATHSRRPNALPHDLASGLICKSLRFRVQETTFALLQSALAIKDRFHDFLPGRSHPCCREGLPMLYRSKRELEQRTAG